MIGNKEKIKNGIIGFIIGDAMGVPFEFKSRKELENIKINGMNEYGTYNLPKGYWSDDSSMVIATMKAIIDNKGNINYKDIMNNFILWAYSDKFTPNNKAFDIGNTTAKALRNYYYKDSFKIYNDPINCGINDFNDNGNGSLMRILPIAYYCYYKRLSDDEIYNIVKNISSLTHSHNISILGCFIYVLFVINLLSGESKENVYSNIRKFYFNKYFNDDILEYYKRILKSDISKLEINDIYSSGYIVDSLEAVIWCFLKNNNYDSSIINSIKLGNDTDTIGALVGGLSGIYYNNINDKWLNDLVRKEEILNLCLKFNIYLKT
jgi:ADP-ribosyl-[dinitrogen reductase] hydrolase